MEQYIVLRVGEKRCGSFGLLLEPQFMYDSILI
jgi:hypothetical protein